MLAIFVYFMQVFRHSESAHIGDKKTVLLKHISESIKLETGHEAQISLLAKGKKIHPSLVVGTEKIFDALIENFSHIEESNFYTRFEEALKKANAAFVGFEEELKKEILEETSISIGIFIEDELYLTQYGKEIETYLVRSGHFSPISQGLHEDCNGKEIFTNIANGKLENDDRVVWSTERLVRHMTKADLGKLFSKQEPGEALINLEQNISTHLASQICVIVSKINIEENPVLIVPEKAEAEIKEKVKLKRQAHLQASARKWVEILHEKAKTIHKKVKEQDLSKFSTKENLKNYKVPLILTGVIILLIIALLVVKVSVNNKKLLQEQEAILNEVQTEINTATARGTYDRDTAANLFNRAEQKALEVFNSGYLRSKSSQILSEIQEQKDKLDKVNRINSPQLVVDLSQERDDVNAIGILDTGDNIYVYEYNALYKITGDQVEMIKIDDNEEIISATYNEDEDEIVFLTANSKVISYNKGNIQFEDNSDGAWRPGVDIESYSGRLYILSPTDNQIYRYPPSRNGYSKAEEYSVDAELSLANDLAIDGYIYVLDQKANIQILSGGQVVDYSIQKDAIQGIDTANAIYTEFEFPYVYVLDSSSNRILVYIKDSRTDNLIYNNQIILEDIGVVKDFVIDKEKNTLYAITDQKVYRVDIE